MVAGPPLRAGFREQSLAEGERVERVKATILYNCLRYVKWPDGTFESPTAPFFLSVLGEKQFIASLEQVLTGKRVDGRNILLARLEKPEDAYAPQVLYTGVLDADTLARTAKMTRGKPILVVGQGKGFAARGGIIGFELEGDQVRFEINAQAARDAGLVISSELLKLATIVGGTTQ